MAQPISQSQLDDLRRSLNQTQAQLNQLATDFNDFKDDVRKFKSGSGLEYGTNMNAADLEKASKKCCDPNDRSCTDKPWCLQTTDLYTRKLFPSTPKQRYYQGFVARTGVHHPF
jgi:hypothetical protein